MQSTAGTSVECESSEDLSARIAELEAAILTDRRILMAGGLQCPCPGCEPSEEEFDPWAPVAARSTPGAFGIQQQQQQKPADSHAAAMTAEVTERLELNQLELAELRQRRSLRAEASSMSNEGAAMAAQDNEKQPDYEDGPTA